jgi:transposase-like protein
MDETYIKAAGEWTYLYLAVDQNGKTADFFLSKRRDVRAAKTLCAMLCSSTVIRSP